LKYRVELIMYMNSGLCILREYFICSFENTLLYLYPSCSFQVISCPYSVVARKRKIRTVTEAVSDIPNGASLLVGGKKF
jgi:hypothetical protein